MTITVRAKVEGALALSPDFGEASAKIMEAFSQAFEQGTANGEIDKIYVESINIAASTTTDYDLAGSLLDIYGLAFTPAEIAAVIVYADAANVNNIVVGGDANGVPIFTDKSDSIPVRPGSLFVITAGGAGIAVTASTGDILQLANSSSGSAVTGKMIVLGRSA